MSRRHVALIALAPLSAAAPAWAQSKAVSEVVVTAAPFPVSLDAVTASVEVLTRDKLETAPAAGLGDVLSGLPGLRSTFNGPGASRPVIRGLSGPRVMILQNGVGLVDASSLSPDHAVASDPGDASRIEVLRGPSTLAYGGSAVGGVVNIIDDRIPSHRPAGGLDGRFEASTTSVDDGWAADGSVTAGRGPWTATVGGGLRESGDYRTSATPVTPALAAALGGTPRAGDRVENTAVALNTYGAGLSYVADDGFAGVAVKRTENRYGLPSAQIDGATAGEGPVRIELEQTRYEARGETPVSLGPFARVRASVAYADYEHAEIDQASGDVGTRFLSHGVEGRAEFVQAARDGWQGAAGVQGLSRTLSASGDEAFIPSVDVSEAAVFVLQRLDRGAWGLEGGARLDRRTLDAAIAGRPTSEAAAAGGLDWSTAPGRRRFTNVSASLAAFWRPADGWFVGLGAARNRRAPTEVELFADGPHAGAGAFEIGDPDLRPETATSLEATLRWANDVARLEAHAFNARYDGYIEDAPTGAFADDAGVLDPDGELPVFRFRQSRARFSGGELEGSYVAWRDGDRSLTLEAAADYVRAASDLGPPARISPYSVTGRVVWASQRWRAEAEARRVGAQDRTAAFERPTDGYSTVNLEATFRPTGRAGPSLFASARNLFDVEAREHASFLKDLAPLPGRNLRVGVSVTF